MAKYKISVDQSICIGCGACTATCPATFEMQDTASGQKSKVIKPDADEMGCAKDAAEVCPVSCIHIHEGEKKII